MQTARRGLERKGKTATHRFDSLQRTSWSIHLRSPLYFSLRSSLTPLVQSTLLGYPCNSSTMCYEPGGLWYVDPFAHVRSVSPFSQSIAGSSKQDNVKTMTLDAHTKITNICLNHDPASRTEGSQSSIRLMSGGHVGTIWTLTPKKVAPRTPGSF